MRPTLNWQPWLITIKPAPAANFTFNTACQGTPAGFTDLSQTNGAGSVVQWQWDFGDPVSGIANTSPLQHPSHNYAATGNPLVRLIIKTGNGCSDTVTYPVQVNPPPPVNFTTTNTCQNSAVMFIPDAGVMNISTIATWFWEFGSGATSVLKNPVHTFVLAGTYNVKLTITDNNGCTNSISRSVVITPEPIVDFSFPNPVCLKSPVQFDNTSTVPGNGLIIKSEWDFGDGNTRTLNTLASVFHTYSTYGSYSVKLTITTTDGCKKTLALPLVILPKPLANFSSQSGCMNAQAQF